MTICPWVWLCSEGIIWTVQPFVTKLVLMATQREQCSEKKWCFKRKKNVPLGQGLFLNSRELCQKWFQENGLRQGVVLDHWGSFPCKHSQRKWNSKRDVFGHHGSFSCKREASSYRESGIQRGMSLVIMIHFHVNVKPTVTEKVEFKEGCLWSSWFIST